MRLWVKLTLDGMRRALSAAAHDAADRAETQGRRIGAKPRRQAKGAKIDVRRD